MLKYFKNGGYQMKKLLSISLSVLFGLAVFFFFIAVFTAFSFTIDYFFLEAFTHSTSIPGFSFAGQAMK